MTFWSGETLRERLLEVVEPADPESIDCAAYTMKVGPEYYVTPTDHSSDPKSVSLKTLQPSEAFAIPPGQFGYLLTEEIVTVPNGVLAFISMRVRIKWKGLINVSGFHVDPGFSGRLTFAVFNAGPVSIHLRRGDPIFLIWFADLDRQADGYAKASKAPTTQIDLGIINQIAGEVYSLQGLADRIRTTEKELGARITALERANGVFAVIAAVIVALLVALGGQWIIRQFVPPPVAPINIPAPASAAAPVPAAPALNGTQ